MIEVRDATAEDLPYMLEQGEQFYKYHPADIKFKAAYVANLFLDMIECGTVLIAEEDGIKKGGIGGLMVPNFFDPDYITLTEMFLWIEKRHRKSRAMISLIKEFTKRGEVANTVALCHTNLTPSLGRVYTRYGYELMETTYIKGE
jgi:hypothetical protein